MDRASIVGAAPIAEGHQYLHRACIAKTVWVVDQQLAQHRQVMVITEQIAEVVSLASKLLTWTRTVFSAINRFEAIAVGTQTM